MVAVEARIAVTVASLYKRRFSWELVAENELQETVNFSNVFAKINKRDERALNLLQRRTMNFPVRRSFLYKDKLGLHLIWKKTSSEDFLEVIWKTSWKSSNALYFSRLTGGNIWTTYIWARDELRMMIGVVEHDGDEHKAGGMAAGGAVKASAATKNHISDRDGGLGKSIVGVQVSHKYGVISNGMNTIWIKAYTISKICLNVCIVRVPADHKTKSQKESEGEQLSGETCGCSKGWRMTAAAVWPETRECVPKREEVSEDDDARSCVSILVSFKAQADS
ncbi:unnamed protein product [Brassica napus]|nr:unnamed protein product [Brassica napus]